MTTPPRVFLSHASEDKERFVLGFATRLRQRGVDVWLDRWEMLPGESLVDGIFAEGIAGSDAVIVVLSRHSVTKPWVHEELNAAVVRKIASACKLIPVVIDDCEVPACLQATIWEKIEDLGSYEPSLDRIVRSIFGQDDKPPLGKEPPFARAADVAIGDLTRGDSLVLKAACEICLEEGTDLQLFVDDLLEKSGKLGLSEEAVRESVQVLAKRGYLEHPFPDNLIIASSAFEEYLKVHWPDYDGLLKRFASCVVNQGMWDRDTIGASLKVSMLLLDHVAEVLEDRKWILLDRFGGGGWEIARAGISPELKRWLEA